MQTKTSAASLVLILFITLITYSSCKKGNNCTGLLATGPNPFAGIVLKDAQNRNLLDPATPGHYDTAFVKRSNSWFRLSPPGTTTIGFSFDYFAVDRVNILRLSPTDQDTVTVVLDTVYQSCGFSSHLSALQYNGVALNPDIMYGLQYTVLKDR